MPIPLEQTMCWDKSSQKNSANTPVLMMAAIARLTGSNPSLACVPLFGDGVSCGFPSPAQDYVEKRLSWMTFVSAIQKVLTWCEQKGIRCVTPVSEMEIY